PPPTGPGIAGQCPVICRRESMNAEPGSGWAIVGNHQDLPDGYEARSLAIADSECTADRGPLVDRAERLLSVKRGPARPPWDCVPGGLLAWMVVRPGGSGAPVRWM